MMADIMVDDGRRCPRHGTVISSPDGLHDGLCGACEAEMDRGREAEIELEAGAAFPEHAKLVPVFEHGRWWVTCPPCGAQWSVAESVPGPFDFERVTEGDGFCEGGA